MRDDAAREELALNNRQARQQDPEVQSTHSEIESGVAATVALHGGAIRIFPNAVVLSAVKLAQTGTTLPPPAGTGPVTTIKPNAAGVVVLPDGSKISVIQASGGDLRIVLDDGRVFIVEGGVANPPSIQIGGEILPGATLAAVFGPFQEVQPATGEPLPPGGSGGFTTNSTTIDGTFQFSELLDNSPVDVSGRGVGGENAGGSGTPGVDGLSVGAQANVSLDEDALDGLSNDPDAVSLFNGQLSYSFGANGADAAAPIAFDAQALTDLGLTVRGDPVIFSWDPLTNTLTGEANGNAVFLLRVLDPATGAYEIEIRDAFDHAAAGKDSIVLALAFTIRDGSGAEVQGILSAAIIDDVPVASDRSDSVNDDGFSYMFLLTEGFGADFDAGADGLASIAVGIAEISNAYGLVLPVPAIAFNASAREMTVSLGDAYRALALGESATLTVPYTVTDGEGDTVTRNMVLTINGTNDRPVIEPGNARGNLREIAGQTAGGDTHEISKTLTFTDPDLSDTHTALARMIELEWSDGDRSDIPPETRQALRNDAFEVALIDGDGGGEIVWSFSIEDRLLDFLGKDETLTIEYRVRVSDDSGESNDSDGRVVTITITGRNDRPQIEADSDLRGRVVEPGDVFGIQEAGRDAGLEISFPVCGCIQEALESILENPANVRNALGEITFLSTGDPALALGIVWNYLDGLYTSQPPLTPEERELVNEAFVHLGLAYAEYLEGGLMPLSDVTAKFAADSDGDGVPQREQSLHDNILGNLNEQVLASRFGVGSAIYDQVMFVVGFFQADPTTRPYYEGVQGEDRSAVEQWDRQNGYVPTASGRVLASDADQNDTLTFDGSANGTYGRFHINANTGRWTYKLDGDRAATQALSEGERVRERFEVTVTDQHGASVTRTVVIVIVGTNDAPEVSVRTGDSLSASIAEGDEGLEASGRFTVSDVDVGDIVQAGVVAVSASMPIDLSENQLGSFLTLSDQTVLDGTEKRDRLRWRFNSDGETFDFLRDGETLDLTYTILVVDNNLGHTTVNVTVRITGTNDGPEMTAGFQAGGVYELPADDPEANTAIHSDSGELTFSDPDLGDTHSAWVSSVTVSGLPSMTLAERIALMGDFDLQLDQANKTIAWTYSASDEAIGFLGAGQTATVVFTVTVEDEAGQTSSQTVTISVNGASENFAPAAANVAASGNEDALIAVVFDGEDSDGTVAGFVIKSLPLDGTLYRNADGTDALAVGYFVAGNEAYFRPDADFSGEAEFEYAARDDEGAESATATATIDVLPVADAPVIEVTDLTTPVARTATDIEVHEPRDGVQMYPVVSATSDGGYLTAWRDGGAVRAQRMNYDGSRNGAEFSVNDSGDADQQNPAMCRLDDGQVVIVWQGTGASGYGIYGSIIGDTGDGSADFFIASDGEAPSVTALEQTTDFLVSYTKNSLTYVQRVADDGSLVGTELAATPAAYSDSYYSEVAALDDGGYVVVSTDFSIGNDVWGRVYNSDNSVRVESLSLPTVSLQIYASVATLQNGNFVVTWYNDGPDGDGVMFKIFAPDGSAVAQAVVPTLLGSSTTVVALPDGGFIVGGLAFDGVGAGVFAQRYDADGDAIGSLFRINANVLGEQFFDPQTAGTPPFAVLDNGDLVAVWNGFGSIFDVHARVFDLGTDVNGVEDQPVVLPAYHVEVTDPSETLAVVLSGFPAGTVFSEGALDEDTGKWVIASGVQSFDFDALTMTPPANWNGSFTLTLEVTVTDSAVIGGVTNTDTRTETRTIEVTIAPDAGDPVAQPVTAAGNEDTLITIVFDGEDSDGTIAGYVIKSLPADGVLYRNSDGSDPLAVGDLVAGNEAYFSPDQDFSGEAEFEYAARDNVGEESAAATATIEVAPVADGPTLQVAPVQGEFVVNTTVAGNEYRPKVTQLVGGFLVVWEDAPNFANPTTVRGQLFDGLGLSIGGEIVLTSAVNDYAVAGLSGGGFIFAIGSANADGDSTGVLVQRYDANGNAVDSAFVANTATIGSQSSPAVLGLANGEYVVAWTSTVGSDIFAQRFSEGGTKLGNEFQLNTVTPDGQFDIRLAALSNGSFVATWTSLNVSQGTTYDIKGQVFSSTGALVGSEFQAHAVAARAQESSNVAGLKNGGFVVVWESQDPSSFSQNKDISAQIFDDDGVKIGAEFVVNKTTSSNQLNPSVVALDDGGFVVIWDSPNHTNVVYGQRYDANYNAVGDEFSLSDRTGIHKVFTQWGVAQIEGGYVAVWEASSPNLDNGSDIYARIFSPSVGIGSEDQPVVLPLIAASFTDTDGSEALTIALSGFPEGAIFSAGAPDYTSGKWMITDPSQIAALAATALTMTPPANWNGSFTLTLEVTVTDSAVINGVTNTDTRTETRTIEVTVNPADDTIAIGSVPDRFDVVEGAALFSMGMPLPASPAGEPEILIDTLPDNGTISLEDGTALTEGQTLTASQFAGLRFMAGSVGADATSSFVFQISDGSETLTYAPTITVRDNDGGDSYLTPQAGPGDSNDVLVSGSRDDFGQFLGLFGGDGDDIIYGGDGIDTLSGGAGRDTLVGGGGGDIFELTDLTTPDLIVDYNSAEGDFVDLTALFQWDFTSGGASPAADGIVSLAGNELRVDLDGIGPDPYAVAAQFSTAPGSVNILYNDINGVTFGLTI